jgi:stage V sporulation protein S
MTAADRNLAYDEALDPDEVIRVGGGSDPQGVASAISMAFYERHEVTLRAVGASAVNQANKAVAIARGYVATRGLDLYMRPGFTNVPGREDPETGQRESISALVFRLNLQ